MRFASLIFLLLLPSMVLAQESTVSRTQLLMGDVAVTIHVRTTENRRLQAQKAMGEAFDLARQIESEVSEYQPGSDVSRLNRATVETWVPINVHLSRILSLAKKISSLTFGAFDITFASRNPFINHSDLQLRNHGREARLMRLDMKIGVSGIAKGYIVDSMSRHLSKKKFRHHLVNAAGDLHAKGTWSVGIQDPLSQKSKLICTMTLKNESLSTSGFYERGSHIIDPHTGKPAKGPLSASIIGPKTFLTDALGTAFFVLTPDQREKAIQRFPHTQAFIINRDHSLSTMGTRLHSCHP